MFLRIFIKPLPLKDQTTLQLVMVKVRISPLQVYPPSHLLLIPKFPSVNTTSAADSEPVSTASFPDSVSPSVNRIKPSVSHVNTLSNNHLSFATWHSRLGHPSGDTMKLVSKLCNIPIMNKTGCDFCSHCCIGKSHRLPSSPSLTIYFNPFDLIYTDLWGPSPV